MEIALTLLLIPALAYLVWRPSPRARSARTDSIDELSGPGTYKVDVVGESNNQDALASITGGKTKEGVNMFVKATLVVEDSNPYDPMAVRIDIAGHTVGYLSREDAWQYRQRLEKAGHPKLTALCDAVIRGGWDRGRGHTGLFGVKLDLPSN
jgi:hypothetical protein